MKLIVTPHVAVADNRQRQHFSDDNLVALKESIVTIGLLHPIVVRAGEDGKFTLVAGERRMRAIKMAHELGEPVKVGETVIPEGMYPCVTLGSLSETEAYEAELEENIRRDDLTWQERAAATARLMELRTLQAERSHQPPPTHVDIAEEITGERSGSYSNNVREELIVARNLDKPEVAKAKSLKEAVKALKFTEQKEKNRRLAAAVGKTFSASDHSLYQGDCRSVMAEWTTPEVFDCLLTDPPYGMGADEFGDSGGRTGAHGYDDSHANFVSLMRDFIPQMTTLMKPQAHAYIFCDIENFDLLKVWMTDSDWWVFRTPLIWINPKAMRTPWPEHGPQRKYQTCLYAVKGKRPALKIAPDVVTFPSDANEGHAAQKPVALLQDYLSRSCRPGDLVLDPFCGSGSIFPAAHALKVKATGIELDQANYGLASRRLGELK